MGRFSKKAVVLSMFFYSALGFCDGEMCMEEQNPQLYSYQESVVDSLSPDGPLACAILGKPKEEEWPKNCKAKPASGFGAKEKKFCLGFAADYFYRLHFTTETMTYAGRNISQKYDRPKFSTEGALFLLAQAKNESDWGASIPAQSHNFWGLDSGPSDYMRFPNFERGVSYYFNHLERGIYGNGQDNPHHPGWPDFLQLMGTEGFTSVDINRTLSSGPWCDQFPSYNTGRLATCEGSAHGKKCPCVDYGGIIMGHNLPEVVSSCLAVYKRFPNEVYPSEVYAQAPSPEATPIERRRIVNEEMTRFAREFCRGQK